jgi:hypothetical protein
MCAGALCLLACAAAGCQSRSKTASAATPATAGSNVPANDRYKVKADTADFYAYGPQQPSGPDETLKKDARLTLVGRAFGYSRVTLADGKTGYIGTEDITPLSAAEIAAEDAALQPLPQAEAQQRLGGSYTIPPEAGNDERLPVADPSPAPKPALTTPFRF